MEQTPKRNRKGPQPAAGEPSSGEANADKKTPKLSAGKASSKKTAARPVSHMAGRSRNKSAPDAGSGIEIDPASYLDGQLLVAMPVMDDERFARSVIYVCAHSSEGAMGIIVNRPAGSIDFPELLAQLDIIDKSSAIKLPESAESMKVLKGGPVDTGRGFVLHSSDFFIEDATLPIDDGICLTATVDILRAIANGGGPKHAILALGYAGWAPGQLETEIQGNGWLHCDADEDLIFGRDIEEKYRRALQKIGIAPGMLSAEAGHA